MRLSQPTLKAIFLVMFLLCMLPQVVVAAFSSDQVRIDLFVDNGDLVSTTSTSTPPPVPLPEPTIPVVSYGNGSPSGPISPNGILTLLPENVSGLSISAIQSPRSISAGKATMSVDLRWTNPSTSQFVEVRVVKSPHGFPKDPLDGEVVYEGRDEAVIDKLLLAGERVYYAVFVKGEDGRYSSGAVIDSNGIMFDSKAAPEKNSDFGEVAKDFLSIDPAHFSISVHGMYDREVRKQNLADIHQLRLLVGDSVTISASREAFPEVLKTILVHITPSKLSTSIAPKAEELAKSTMSFLLSFNGQLNTYEATFFTPSEGGIYDVELKILDYKNNILHSLSIEQALSVEKPKVKFQRILENRENQFFKAETPLLLAIFIILIFLTLAFSEVVRFVRKILK